MVQHASAIFITRRIPRARDHMGSPRSPRLRGRCCLANATWTQLELSSFASGLGMREEMIRNGYKMDTNAKSLPAMSFRTLDRFRMFQIRVLPASLSGTLSLYSKKHMRSGQAFTSSRRLPRAWLCGYVLCSVRESLPCCSLPWKALAEA